MRKKYLFLTIIGIAFHTLSFSQEVNAEKRLSFFVGLKEGVTPIPLSHHGIDGYYPQNILDLDERLTGVAFLAGINKKFGKSYSLTLEPSVKRGKLYAELPSFKAIKKTTFNIDLEAEKTWHLRHFNFFLDAGIGVFDLNSGYMLTQEYLGVNNQLYHVTTKENYTFVAPAFLFGFEKKRISATFQFDYIAKDPGYSYNSIILPEVKLQYNVFSFGK